MVLTATFRGLDATLERLRADCQLDEALATSRDPLHLTAVFGIDDTTAIKHVAAARELLDTAAERTPRVTREPRDQSRSPGANTPEFARPVLQSG